MLAQTDNSCILLPPHQPLVSITDTQLIQRVCVHFVTCFKIPFATTQYAITAANIEEYGRVCQLDGNTMQASLLVSHMEDRRDATWIRVSVSVPCVIVHPCLLCASMTSSLIKMLATTEPSMFFSSQHATLSCSIYLSSSFQHHRH